MNYAFIDSENIVRSVLYFEEAPEDISIFIQSQEVVTGHSPLIALEITEEYRHCAMGTEFTNNEFRPIQPYPSWIWDETKRLWAAPVLHPYLLSGVDSFNYEWDEENQKWNKVIP